MKTLFKLQHDKGKPASSWIEIMGLRAKRRQPYVVIWNDDTAKFYIPDKDLEKFAVNILKALKSKRLK